MRTSAPRQFRIQFSVANRCFVDQIPKENPFMPTCGRPRVYATDAEKMRAYRLRQRREAVAPDVPCRVVGSCTLYQADWRAVYALFPRRAAVITDPPYKSRYDYTKARRRPSRWEHNFVGMDADFDPSPWVRFPEVVLFGADRYRDRLPRGGSWICWDKLAGTTPADFAPGEWAWTNLECGPQFYPHLWRGGQRAGEENISRLPQKDHQAQKPVSLMQRCVQLLNPGLTIIDPFMGSGTTPVAALREGRRCIGVEIDPEYYATACQRVQKELQQLPLFPQPPRRPRPRMPAPVG